MTSPAAPPCHASSRLSFVLGALLLAMTGAQAQFKVVGADGKVTYTDREPAQPEGKVTALGAKVPVQAAEPDLPFDLRQVVSKYPVTLYTTSGACEPCVQARQFLKQRGIPFSERQAASNEDIEALEKISGGREAPTLTVGPQVLRGFGVDSWAQYLDAAGYPRDSRLPASYQYRPATPIVERREAAVGRSDAAPTPPAAFPRSAAPTSPGPSGGIRF
ncbi:MAG TPA: glutaredoxin family protein [Caldimonas sp.]|nr:glutaredoxin family protein [Caldimonas sp.]